MRIEEKCSKFCWSRSLLTVRDLTTFTFVSINSLTRSQVKHFRRIIKLMILSKFNFASYKLFQLHTLLQDEEF
jgi:hypothetical protein